MKLWMSEATESDVGDQYAVARREIEPAVNERISTLDYGALKKWAFIGIVVSARFTGFDEVKKCRKKQQEFEFSLRIDHATFKAADPIGHRKLIMASLLRSIDEMRKLVPKGIDYDRLEKDVRDVAIAKGWLPDPAHYAAAAPPPPPGVSVPEGDVVKKLHKRVKGVLHYEEAWTHEGVVKHHWGKVGDEGKWKEAPLHGRRPYDAVQEVLAKAVARGFAEIPSDKLDGFVIQYNIDDMGTTEDLDKIHALEDLMDETLGWLGLGHCDGNSIGSGTMEVFCYVVDGPLAIECVKKTLADTPFADYSAMTMLEKDDEDDEDA